MEQIGHIIYSAIDCMHFSTQKGNTYEDGYNRFVASQGQYCKLENIDPKIVYRMAYHIVFGYEDDVVSKTLDIAEKSYGYELPECQEVFIEALNKVRESY